MDIGTGSHRMLLFGGELNWMQDDWTASDDRVRGGKSQSYLIIDQGQAIFAGHLDTKTLGGAGFASQRTTKDDRRWDLGSFDGIEIVCNAKESDDKVYAFVLKDEILPRGPNGREQSTISWEFNFKVADMASDKDDLRSLRIPWNDFSATYRGRSKPDANPLNRSDIKRMSIMMRSFYDFQSGDFRLAIRSISAYAESQGKDSVSDVSSITSLKKEITQTGAGSERSFWSYWLCCAL